MMANADVMKIAKSPHAKKCADQEMGRKMRRIRNVVFLADFFGEGGVGEWGAVLFTIFSSRGVLG